MFVCLLAWTAHFKISLQNFNRYQIGALTIVLHFLYLSHSLVDLLVWVFLHHNNQKHFCFNFNFWTDGLTLLWCRMYSWLDNYKPLRPWSSKAIQNHNITTIIFHTWYEVLLLKYCLVCRKHVYCYCAQTTFSLINLEHFVPEGLVFVCMATCNCVIMFFRTATVIS